jgi:hypothetical protein
MVLIKYFPKLGPFTNTWDDLVNDSGEPLHFGILNYNNTTTSTFCARVKPRDVKSALVLLNYLFLEHHTVEDSFLNDSAMLLIKQSSEGTNVHFNSIGKPNCMFAWFVINFLAMSMLFDTFIDHRSLVAPMPFKKTPLSEEHSGMLVRNKHILIKFCLGQVISRIDKYFLNKKTGDAGRGSVNLDKLWSTSTKYYRQIHVGIISSFESYSDSYTSAKKEQSLWIHHLVILQLFHPLFHNYPGEECEYIFKDDNHHLFLERMTNTQLDAYTKKFMGIVLITPGCG